MIRIMEANKKREREQDGVGSILVVFYMGCPPESTSLRR